MWLKYRKAVEFWCMFPMQWVTQFVWIGPIMWSAGNLLWYSQSFLQHPIFFSFPSLLPKHMQHVLRWLDSTRIQKEKSSFHALIPPRGTWPPTWTKTPLPRSGSESRSWRMRYQLLMYVLHRKHHSQVPTLRNANIEFEVMQAERSLVCFQRG